MRPSSAPKIPGNTEWERFDNAVRSIFKVPKETVVKEERRLKRINKRKKQRKDRD